jgi:DNA (cytosine-5)-methyltransferase 1
VDQPTICIAGNIIDRQPENGGNGFGYQEDVSYTLTGMDRHAVMDQPYQKIVGTLGRSDAKGIDSQYVSEDKCIVERQRLIRRLTPLECERLQGFPDGWTLIPEASDSARYKALGNSVAIPCVDFVLRGIAYFLRKIKEEENPAM